MKPRYFRLLCLWSVLFVASLSLPSCQLDPSVTVPRSEEELETTDNNPSLWSQEIGPSGGSITGANAVFAVPAGALSTSVTLSMSYTASLSNEVVMGPAGQQFAEACTLTLDKPSGYDPEDTYHVFLWNTASSTWQDLGGTDNGATVSVSITHFSRYKVDEVS